MYKPGEPPIREESHEIVQGSGQSQAAEPEEYVVRRQTLGELYDSTPYNDFRNVGPHEEQSFQRRHSGGSRSTLTTEFSRLFEFVDAHAETGVEDREQMHSAWWLQESMKQKESGADSVLVDTPPAFSAAEPQEPQDDLDELQVGADALTNDIFSVAIQRVKRAEPAPLTPSAMRAAQVITLDILHRAMRDDLCHLQASYAGLQCGPRQMKLASTIVQRVLDLASSRDSKWSKKVLQATSLLVKDVFSSALIYVSRGDDRIEPDHTWSREALQASCLIIRQVMDDATGQTARQATTNEQSTTGPKQQQTSPAQPPHAASSHDRDLVDSEFTAVDQPDIIDQAPSARQAQSDPQDENLVCLVASPSVDDVPSEHDSESAFNDSRTSSLSML